MKRRKTLFILLSLAIGTGIPLLAAEIALRFLPVNTGLNATPVNDDNPIFRFAPNRPFTWSRGWDFFMVNRGRVNNAGFVNDHDYSVRETAPLLAVVGDSYVEAVMVPFPHTLHARLARRVAGRGRVYSFGASGAPLSQYLAWARHVDRTYKPEGLVFVIIANDFDESLLEYRRSPGFHHYKKVDGKLELVRVDFQPTAKILGYVARRTELGIYLINNLKVLELREKLRSAFRSWTAGPNGANGRPEYLGNVPRAVGGKRLEDSHQAVDAFLRDLAKSVSLPKNRVLFLVDGVRYPDRQDQASYFVKMRTYFLKRARRLGYSTVDLDPLFFAEHRRNGTRFEYPRDGHWNPSGHELAAEAVVRSELYRNIFEPTADARR